jgi:hypothetical protein
MAGVICKPVTTVEIGEPHFSAGHPPNVPLLANRFEFRRGIAVSVRMKRYWANRRETVCGPTPLGRRTSPRRRNAER